MLPHMIRVDGQSSHVTQPPILGWAVERILARGGDRDWAAACLPFLKRYLDWDRRCRDRNGNGIPEWHIEGNPLCRCGESGLDNSSVYDRAVLLDAPDFGSFLAHDYACAARIAESVGDARTAGECAAASGAIAEAVRSLLWCDEEQFFFHRDFDGRFVPVRAVSGFMPLFAGIASAAQAEGLRSHLRNPGTFGAAMPVPSESLDSGTFCKDMWRGPSWMNTSYLVYLGLQRYGFAADAADLRRSMLQGVRKWYERDGCIWEFYDALDLTSPRNLDRKQRLISGQGIAPISDYHFSASVAVCLLCDAGRIRRSGLERRISG